MPFSASPSIGLVATLAGGAVADAWEARGNATAKLDVAVRRARAAAVVCAMVFSPSFGLAATWLCLRYVFSNLADGPAYAAICMVLPPSLRGTAMGVTVVLCALLGALATVVIALFNSRFHAFETELAIGTLVALLPGAALFAFTSRALRAVRAESPLTRAPRAARGRVESAVAAAARARERDRRAPTSERAARPLPPARPLRAGPPRASRHASLRSPST